MYDKLVRWMYDLHMLIQALFCLAFPVAVCGGLAYLAVYLSWTQTWIYAVLVPIGTLGGLYSMIRFLLRASAQAQAIETAAEQRRAARRAEKTKPNGD